MKETRKLNKEDLRQLCIKRKWYTRGCNFEYGKLLAYAENCENVTTAVIVEIAEDIYYHSDKEYWKDHDGSPIENICFEVASVCNSYFEQE